MVQNRNNPGFGTVVTKNSPFSILKTLKNTDISLNEGFWTKRQSVNRMTSLLFGYKMLEKSGNFDNLRIAAGTAKGNFRGYVFLDSDIYKWLEAVAWEMGKTKDNTILTMADKAIELIAAAQRPDGYINSYVQTREKPEPWIDLDNGHELYCAGFLFQAGIAYKRALNDDRLLKIACRFADNIYSVFGTGLKQGTCGHPEVEMALIELYREVGNPHYLDLAKYFIDQRGKNVMQGHRSYGPEYNQDHIPVRDASEAVGHAVRQLYLASGVTDLYLETGEQSLLDAMFRLSKDITETKEYITGGMGSRFDGEAFGDPYELPTDQCYCETCAAIASLMWNWRMLLATGDGFFADEIERALYNNILASPALDGQHYFYINPLLLREAKNLRLSTDLPPSEVFIPDQRPEWHDCACCPPNVMRIISSFEHYSVTQNSNGVQIHQFAPLNFQGELFSEQIVKFNIKTEYPWQGLVNLQILETGESPWVLSLRVPGWSKHPTLKVNGKMINDFEIEKGYILLRRSWQNGDVVELDLNMEAKFVLSNPRIDATRGCVAIQRGPVVYCLEDKDQVIKGKLLDVVVNIEQPLLVRWDGDLLGGVVVVEAKGYFTDIASWKGHLYQPLESVGKENQKVANLLAIPYYAWGNRIIGGMRVWIPEKPI